VRGSLLLGLSDTISASSEASSRPSDWRVSESLHIEEDNLQDKHDMLAGHIALSAIRTIAERVEIYCDILLNVNAIPSLDGYQLTYTFPVDPSFPVSFICQDSSR
jgi:hypothetical protein